MTTPPEASPPEAPAPPDSPAKTPDVVRPQPRIRRKRRTTRRAALTIVVAMGLAWGAFEIWWRVTAEPAPAIDYSQRLVDLTESYQPAAGENGWESLMEAITAYDVAIATHDEQVRVEEGMSDSVRLRFDTQNLCIGPLDLVRFAREVTLLELIEAEGTWDLFAEAMAAPRMVRPRLQANMLMNGRLGELSRLREMARALVARMRVASESGDADALVRSFEMSLALAQMTSRQSFLIDRLVGNSLYQLATGELRLQLSEQEFDEVTCRALLEMLNARSDRPPMKMCLEAERASQLDLIQFVYTDDGHGDGRLDATNATALGGLGIRAGGPGFAVGNVISVYAAGRKETTEVVNEMFDQLIERARLSPADRAAQTGTWDDDVESLSPRFHLVKLTLPGFGRSVVNEGIVESLIEGTRLMLHLEIHFARHRAYPATLGDLDADLRTPPIVDPLCVGAYVYRLVDDDEFGRPYLLYGVGADGEDDHATQRFVDPTQPVNWLGSGQKRMDLLITTVREPRREDEY